MTIPPSDLNLHIEQARANLEGWREPNGHLVPTEPDPEERARVRITLRGMLAGLLTAAGQKVPDFGAEDHRDRLRIRDAAVFDYQAELGERAKPETDQERLARLRAGFDSLPEERWQHAVALVDLAGIAHEIHGALLKCAEAIPNPQDSAEVLGQTHRRTFLLSLDLLRASHAIYGIELPNPLGGKTTMDALRLLLLDRADKMKDQRAADVDELHALLIDACGPDMAAYALKIAGSMAVQAVGHMEKPITESDKLAAASMLCIRQLGALLFGTANDMARKAGIKVKDDAPVKARLPKTMYALQTDNGTDDSPQGALERWRRYMEFERRSPIVTVEVQVGSDDDAHALAAAKAWEDRCEIVRDSDTEHYLVSEHADGTDLVLVEVTAHVDIDYSGARDKFDPLDHEEHMRQLDQHERSVEPPPAEPEPPAYDLLAEYVSRGVELRAIPDDPKDRTEEQERTLTVLVEQMDALHSQMTEHQKTEAELKLRTGEVTVVEHFHDGVPPRETTVKIADLAAHLAREDVLGVGLDEAVYSAKELLERGYLTFEGDPPISIKGREPSWWANDAADQQAHGGGLGGSD